MDEVVDTDLTIADGVPAERADLQIRLLGTRIRIGLNTATGSPVSLATAVLVMSIAGCFGAGLIRLIATAYAGVPGALVIIAATAAFMTPPIIGAGLIFRVRARRLLEGAQHKATEERTSEPTRTSAKSQRRPGKRGQKRRSR